MKAIPDRIGHAAFGKRPSAALSPIAGDLSGGAASDAISNFRFGPLYYDLRRLVFSSLFQDIGHDHFEKLQRADLEAALMRHLGSAIRTKQVQLESGDIHILRKDLLDDVIGYGPIEDLLGQDSITDIMVIAPKRVFYEAHGQIHRSALVFENEAHVRAICQRIARRIGRRIDESAPMCDARLPDGSRVNMIVPPLALDGTALTIRKFLKQRLTFADLVTMGAITPDLVRLLTWLVAIRCNILVVGGTGSGKTTFLNCLNRSLPDGERIITCEDAAELQLQQPHIVRLETRPNNLEGSGEVSMRDLIRNSLRMRPDRIIVGEIRGEEAFDFVQAMNTGHDGSMGTMHANSAIAALSRLEGLISLGAPSLPSRTIKQMMTSAIDIIIEMRRMPDGTRRVTELIEITGSTEDKIETRAIMDHDKRDPILTRADIVSDRILRKAKARERHEPETQAMT